MDFDYREEYLQGRADLMGMEGKGGRPHYFLQSLDFCSHFEELQTMLFEVELIISSTPLVCVYPNTI